MEGQRQERAVFLRMKVELPGAAEEEKSMEGVCTQVTVRLCRVSQTVTRTINNGL